MASDPFFGGTDYKKLSTLTPGQESMLAGLNSLYSDAGNFRTGMQSTYQGAPQDYFRQTFEKPALRQYQSTLANLEHNNKRHSSFTANMRRRTDQDYLTNLGSMRGEFMNQERLREMQALENLRQSQMGVFGIQNQLAQTSLGTRAFENIAQENTGILGKMSSLLNMGGSLAGSIMGMGGV